MSVLVTGVTGFIGSELATRLIQEGFKVHGLVRHSPRPATNIPKGVVTITGDLLDYHSLRKAVGLSQPEYVFHTAAMTPVRYSFENPFIFEAINCGGTMNMVHASLECPVLKRFIQASSMEVYRQKDTPLKEEDELYGHTPYGVTKVASELYVRIASDCYGLPYTILRPCNTYGRKTEKGYLIEKIVTGMLEKDGLEINGEPSLVRSFMYVDDHVNAYLSCIDDKALNQVFNFGPEKGSIIKDLVETCRYLLSWKGEVVYGVNPRPNEALKLEIDASKAKRVLGWTAKVSLEDGLRKTIAIWKEKKGC